MWEQIQENKCKKRIIACSHTKFLFFEMWEQIQETNARKQMQEAHHRVLPHQDQTIEKDGEKEADAGGGDTSGGSGRERERGSGLSLYGVCHGVCVALQRTEDYSTSEKTQKFYLVNNLLFFQVPGFFRSHTARMKRQVFTCVLFNCIFFCSRPVLFRSYQVPVVVWYR